MVGPITLWDPEAMTNLKMPSFPLLGGCPCGTIRYEIAAMPLALYVCHCTDCQRRTGSAFALNMPVWRKDVRLMGEPKRWRSKSPSGAMTTTVFCGNCGGRIHGEREGRSDIIVLRAGTLDDTSWLRPAAHNYVKSAQPWEVFGKNIACYETVPEDFAVIGVAWRKMMAQGGD